METDAGLIVPLIHMNGTSKERLTEQLSDAYDALDLAYKALKEASPNGRDYYHTPGLLEKAIAQHNKRLFAIDEVMKSIQSVSEEVFFQGEKR